MKKLIALLLSLVLVMSLLSACGGDTKEETTTETEKGTETEKDTSSGDETKSDDMEEDAEPVVLTMLTDSTDGWIRNFNPYSTNVYGFVQGFMFEHLVLFNSYQNNEEIMWLAEDIISEPDNKTLTIKVRQGIKWSDGEDFNAEDVAYSFTISKDHPSIDRSGNWGDNGKISAVNILDDYTVEIVMAEENAFHRFDVVNQAMMIPEHIFSTIDDPATAVIENPVVTGAFSEVVDFTPEMVVLGRNPNYWKGDDLEVDQLRVPQFNGNDGALALLQTGQIDWAHIFIPDAETTYVQGDAGRKFWYGKNDAVRIALNYMTPNENNKKAFNDPEFKKAFSMAVDRKGIIDSAVFGYLSTDVPPVTGLPPALMGHANPEAQKLHAEWTTYDLAKAKETLTAAGYVDTDGDGWVENPDGTPIEFEILSPAGWSDWNDGAIIAAEGLREIGINASANAPDLGIIIESWESGQHDALYSGYGAPSNIWKFYYDTLADQSRVKTATWWSITQTNYTNDRITELVAEMPTADAARTKEITDEIEMFFTENMINIPILYNGNWFVYNDSRLTGWATEADPYCNPASVVHDIKVFHLLNLEPVK
jgi:peptide/nickel transport system substrate-binding protein